MKKIIFLFASLLTFGAANAQTSVTTSNILTVNIPTVAMLKVAPSGSAAVSLTYDNITSAGGNFTDKASATNVVYLQYSSILPATGVSARKILVSTTSTSTTAQLLGIRATVQGTTAAVDATGAVSAGTLGAAKATAIPLIKADGTTVALGTNTSDYELVTGILSGFTGQGATSGVGLTFATSTANLSVDQYSSLRAKAYAIEVTYTLTDVL
jgi:hypothetical protein